MSVGDWFAQGASCFAPLHKSTDAIRRERRTNACRQEQEPGTLNGKTGFHAHCGVVPVSLVLLDVGSQRVTHTALFQYGVHNIFFPDASDGMFRRRFDKKLLRRSEHDDLKSDGTFPFTRPRHIETR